MQRIRTMVKFSIISLIDELNSDDAKFLASNNSEFKNREGIRVKTIRYRIETIPVNKIKKLIAGLILLHCVTNGMNRTTSRIKVIVKDNKASIPSKVIAGSAEIGIIRNRVSPFIAIGYPSTAVRSNITTW
jgi:hypothetical protein